ncbi:MAG: hypothetical protein Kow0079_17010 [Vicingaceae bacterium]
MVLEQDIKVKGTAVFVDNAKFKSDLKVLGTTRLKDKLIADDIVKFKSLADTTNNVSRLVAVQSNGKLINIGNITVPSDDTYTCNYVMPWATASSLSSSGLPNEVVLCPEYASVGIGISNPESKFHVVGTTTLNGKVGIGTLGNINNQANLEIASDGNFNTINTLFTTNNNFGSNLYIIPRAQSTGNSIFQDNDVALLWNGKNNTPTTGLVIANQSNLSNGFRINNAGQFGFNGKIENQVQYAYKSNSLLSVLIETASSTPGPAMGIRTLVNDDNDLAFSIAKNGTGSDIFSHEDVFRVYGNGIVWATEINVELPPFPDYVFAKNYKKLTIKELEAYITKYHHLPNMPSAKEVKENGIGVGELQVKLVEKIEELTLYIIELQKQNEELRKQIKNLKQ